MGKIKSAIVFSLITVIIAVLCFVCFVPFPVGWVEEAKEDGTSESVPFQFFNPIINWTEKSADLGGYQYGDGADYLGGSFSIVYYPDGVISEQEFIENRDAKEGEEQTEYVEKYTPYKDVNGRLYLEKDTVCDGGETPTEEFLSSCEVRLETLKKRFEGLHAENLQLEVCDNICVRVSLPASMTESVAAVIYYSYLGQVKLLYGTSSDAASASQILPVNENPMSDYIKGVSSHSNAAGNIYVQVSFTDVGREVVGNATSGASETTGYLFLQVGEGNTVINLSVSERVNDDLYISGSYTSETANIVATVIDTAIKNPNSYGMNLGNLYRTRANFGVLTLGGLTLETITLVYIAFGILFAAMLVFFFIRYRRLGFVHLYTYLTFLTLMVIIFWAIPIPIGVGTLAVLGIASVLLSVSNAIAFEYARKEYAVGKTIDSSVKTGYKRCFWHIFDLHIVLLIVSLLVYLIGIGELSVFGLALTFGVALSGIGTLALNRFLWYVMMRLSKDAGKFCHYKREEVEEDD